MARFGRSYPLQHLWVPKGAPKGMKFDAIGTPYISTTNTATVSGSGSHTATAGADVYVFVEVFAFNAGHSPATRTVTYDPTGINASMDSVFVLDVINSFGNQGWIEVFRLTGAPGGTKTWSLSITGQTSDVVIAQSISYTGVKGVRAAGINTATAGTALATGSIPSATGRIMLQAFSTQINSTSSQAVSGYNQTSRYNSGNQSDGSNSAALLIGDAPGAATVSFSGTAANTTQWNSVGMELLPFSAAAIKNIPVAANAATVAIPDHEPGDLIIIWAYNGSGFSNSTPTAPAAGGTVPAWVDIDANAGANNNASRTVKFVATASNTTSGSWTNATSMIAVVIHGQNATSPIGGHAESGGASTTSIVAPAVTMGKTDGSSVLLHFFGCLGGGGWSTAPAGYSGRATTSVVALLAKNDTTSDGSVTLTASAAGAYRAATVEIMV